MDTEKQVKLLVTLGDMAGIGPEVVLKALPQVLHSAAQITLVGNQQQLIVLSKRLTESISGKLSHHRCTSRRRSGYSAGSG